MRNKSNKANKATPARLPITDPTTFGVSNGLLGSFPVIGAVVDVAEGAAVFAGSTIPPPPNPPAVLEAIADRLVLCVVDVGLDVTEDDVEEFEDVGVEDSDDDGTGDDDADVCDNVVCDDEGVSDAVELGAVELGPGSDDDASALDDVGAGADCDSAGADCALTSFVGTPDGHGYAGTGGTSRSLGNGGTDGTDGTAAMTATVGSGDMEMAAAAMVASNAATTVGVGLSPGVTVAREATFPAESREAMTSTVTTSRAGCTWRR